MTSENGAIVTHLKIFFFQGNFFVAVFFVYTSVASYGGVGLSLFISLPSDGASCDRGISCVFSLVFVKRKSENQLRE